MTALIKSIGDKFSDLLLDLELFFSRFSRKKGPALEEGKVLGSVMAREKSDAPAEGVSFSLKMTYFSTSERIAFFDQMATLIGSGVTLIDSLSLMQAQIKKRSIKKFYAEMIHRINAGLTLSATMTLFPRVFSSMQSALVEAGEKSGNLKTVFARIAENLEDQQEFMRKNKGAMFYPVVVLCMALTMVTGMIIFVIPKVSKMYEQSHAKLPALTQAVIDISAFVSHQYPMILGVAAFVILFFWLLITKTRLGKLAYEKFISALPVFGQISSEKNIMLFTSNLGMLMESGVLISDAFEITGKTIDNLHYKKAMGEIRHGIILGKNVSEMMGLKDIKAQKFEYNPLFPLQVAQLIHIGEVTGTLSKMLIKIRDNYHKSVDFKLKNLSTMVEPLMIFFVALLVGSILLAVMLPFFYIGTTIR